MYGKGLLLTYIQGVLSEWSKFAFIQPFVDSTIFCLLFIQVVIYDRKIWRITGEENAPAAMGEKEQAVEQSHVFCLSRVFFGLNLTIGIYL